MPKRVKREFSTEDWEAYYRRYQRTLTREYLVPILSSWGVELAGKTVLEVGCGNGGCGAELARAGCRVVMMDVDERLVSLARQSNEREGIDARVFVGDVLDGGAAFYREGPFDLVLFRDVMEHLDDPARALRVVRPFLSPEGRVFVVFPPYFSPYGAHQQILPRKTLLFLPYNKLPYLQLLPRRMFLAAVRGSGEAGEEVTRLAGIRLTMRKFERSAGDAGFVVIKKRRFLSRPSFALRYGLPVIGASFVGKIPWLNEIVVTAAYYLLAPAIGP